jgi:hypothetical protein
MSNTCPEPTIPGPSTPGIPDPRPVPEDLAPGVPVPGSDTNVPVPVPVLVPVPGARGPGPQPVKYQLTAQDHAVLGRTKDYLAAWERKTPGIPSLQENFGAASVGSVGPSVLAWAFLAATDDLVSRNIHEPFYEPILVILARSPYIELARTVIKINHPVTTQTHHVYWNKSNESSDSRDTDTGSRTSVERASVWTLARFLDTQIRAGVNRCFSRRPGNSSGFPLVTMQQAQALENKLRNVGAGKSGQDPDAARSRPPRPAHLIVEDATWDGRASMELCSGLTNLMIRYNAMLGYSCDFAEAIKHSNELRRQTMARSRAERAEKATMVGKPKTLNTKEKPDNKSRPGSRLRDVREAPRSGTGQTGQNKQTKQPLVSGPPIHTRARPVNARVGPTIDQDGFQMVQGKVKGSRVRVIQHTKEPGLNQTT